jgi:hypothetical protein
MSELAWAFEQEASAVDDAATKALDLIRQYSETDPHDASDSNPWNRPDDIFVALDRARNELTEAWEKLRGQMAEDDQQNNTEKKQLNEEDFRAAYMNMVTDAFSDVLEDLRNSEDDIDLDVLVDCLQSGMDLMLQDDKELFLQELGTDEEQEDKDDQGGNTPKLTPHEIRRRQLGFHHLEAAA